MLFSTPTQFAVLALVLVAGWLFGLASHPGGRKWRARYTAERDAHAATRKAAEARIAATDKRATELERENARLAKAVPVAPVASPVTPVVAARPVANAAARPAYTGGRRGWFEFDDRHSTV